MPFLLGAPLPVRPHAALPDPAPVQGNTGFSPPTKAFQADVVAGNVGVVFVQQEGTVGSLSSITVTDSRGTTYTMVDSYKSIGGVDGAVFTGTFTSSGPCTVTVSGYSGSYNRITVTELTGVLATPTSVRHDTGTTTGGTVTIPPGKHLLLGIIGHFISSTTFTDGAGWTHITAGGGADSTLVEAKTYAIATTDAVTYSADQSAANSVMFSVLFGQ